MTKKRFNEEKLRKEWRAASKEQRELATEAAIDYEKRQVSNIDMAYRKAAVFLTGAALLAAGITNLHGDLQTSWLAAIAAMITIVMTILVILPKPSNMRLKRVEGIERMLKETPAQTEEEKFIRRTRHVFNMSKTVRLKRNYMYIAGVSLIIGVLALFLSL